MALSQNACTTIGTSGSSRSTNSAPAIRAEDPHERLNRPARRARSGIITYRNSRHRAREGEPDEHCARVLSEQVLLVVVPALATDRRGRAAGEVLGHVEPLERVEDRPGGVEERPRTTRYRNHFGIPAPRALAARKR